MTFRYFAQNPMSNKLLSCYALLFSLTCTRYRFDLAKKRSFFFTNIGRPQTIRSYQNDNVISSIRNF